MSSVITALSKCYFQNKTRQRICFFLRVNVSSFLVLCVFNKWWRQFGCLCNYSSAYSHNDKAKNFCWLTFRFADGLHSQPRAAHALRNLCLPPSPSHKHTPRTRTHTHAHTQDNGLCLAGRYVASTHTPGLIEQSVTTDGCEPCRCLCVLLLSIVNKDLLFLIIESYDWLMAHDPHLHTHTR